MKDYDQLEDYATGKSMVVTQKEMIRQEYERMIIDVKGYPKEDLDIDFSFSLSETGQILKADIALFKTGAWEIENIDVIVDIETPGTSFMGKVPEWVLETKAEYYIWFNGWDYYSIGPFHFHRDIQAGQTEFIPVPTLPKKRERGVKFKSKSRRHIDWGTCPSCGGALEPYCLIVCTHMCYKRKQLICISCDEMFWFREIKPKVLPKGAVVRT